jgi:hypothetical protein
MGRAVPSLSSPFFFLTLAAAALLLVLGAEYAGELVANRIEGVLDRGRCSAQYIALVFLVLLFFVGGTLFGRYRG